MKMQSFELKTLLGQHQAGGAHWSEFLRVPALSVGIYTLPAGGVDPQSPHSEDEVYLVLGGQAALQVGDEDLPVQPGSLVYVPAQVDHRFHSIAEDLTVLVFFAPAEGTAKHSLQSETP